MLTAKQEAFCIAYIETGNASEAATSTGFEFESIPSSGYYVYMLADPVSWRVFYVGKGKGKRIKHHAARCKAGKVDNAEKHKAIREIIERGDHVLELVFGSYQDERAAYCVERKLIESLRGYGLTNIMLGIVTNDERAEAQARELLTRTKTYKDWIRTASTDQLNAAAKIGGSHVAFYREFIGSLLRLARCGHDDAARFRSVFGV